MDQSAIIVLLLNIAQYCPYGQSTRRKSSQASHAAIPKAMNFGGRSPALMVCSLWVTRCHPAVVRHTFRHSAVGVAAWSVIHQLKAGSYGHLRKPMP